MKVKELDSIIETVDKYGTGITTGDIELMRSVFHPKAMMYGRSGDDVTIVEIEGLFGYVASQTPPVVSGEQHRCIIKSIDVFGNCASAEVLQENCYGVNYINYFQLLKVGEQWMIVSKVYDVIAEDKIEDASKSATKELKLS